MSQKNFWVQRIPWSGFFWSENILLLHRPLKMLLVGHYYLLWKTAKYNGGNWSNFLTKTHHLTRGCWIFLAKKPTTDSFPSLDQSNSSSDSFEFDNFVGLGQNWTPLVQVSEFLNIRSELKFFKSL